MDGFAKTLGNAVIGFDEQDRVVDVRVDGFGLKEQRRP
jgi:hypothetical protein